MCNIIKSLTTRIEEARATNQQPCKNYKTESAAEKATAKMAQQAATYFNKDQDVNCRKANYVVFYIEAWGRWVGCIDMTELLRRPDIRGGYLGICASAGFYCY